eukprot:m.87667 g.87667  ORF g.87667 m.87667 type:complete len:152 (-) comp12247_c1_seq2:95-550(-)
MLLFAKRLQREMITRIKMNSCNAFSYNRNNKSIKSTIDLRFEVDWVESFDFQPFFHSAFFFFQFLSEVSSVVSSSFCNKYSCAQSKAGRNPSPGTVSMTTSPLWKFFLYTSTHQYQSILLVSNRINFHNPQCRLKVCKMTQNCGDDTIYYS